MIEKLTPSQIDRFLNSFGNGLISDQAPNRLIDREPRQAFGSPMRSLALWHRK